METPNVISPQNYFGNWIFTTMVPYPFSQIHIFTPTTNPFISYPAQNFLIPEQRYEIPELNQPLIEDHQKQLEERQIEQIQLDQQPKNKLKSKKQFRYMPTVIKLQTINQNGQKLNLNTLSSYQSLKYYDPCKAPSYTFNECNYHLDLQVGKSQKKKSSSQQCKQQDQPFLDNQQPYIVNKLPQMILSSEDESQEFPIERSKKKFLQIKQTGRVYTRLSLKRVKEQDPAFQYQLELNSRLKKKTITSKFQKLKKSKIYKYKYMKKEENEQQYLVKDYSIIKFEEIINSRNNQQQHNHQINKQSIVLPMMMNTQGKVRKETRIQQQTMGKYVNYFQSD